MIYIYHDDGSVSTYSESSGIEYIVQYRTSYKTVANENVKLLTDKYIILAAQSVEHMYELIDRYEEDYEIVRNSVFDPVYSEVCVRGNDGELYKFWYRDVIKIDWSKDYRFYDNVEQETKLSAKSK